MFNAIVIIEDKVNNIYVYGYIYDNGYVGYYIPRNNSFQSSHNYTIPHDPNVIDRTIIQILKLRICVIDYDVHE